jgi:tetrahydromethanopterin S-methyltransferase subunit A
VTGDHTIGSRTSPVEFLITGEGPVDVPMDDGIAGTMKTENQGLEKVSVNVVSEPRIRFLIVYGREGFGHPPADALSCLVMNGLDERGRAIEARSAVPYLGSVPREAVERFRGQVEIIDLIHPREAEEIIDHDPPHELDAERNAELRRAMRDFLARDPGRFPESPLIVRSRGLEADAGKTTRSIDNMAVDFASHMQRLPRGGLSAQASLMAISAEFGAILDPVVREAPSVEFAERLKPYNHGAK